MARISNYAKDAQITVDDKLLGSSYEGEGISGPIYETKNFKISNLASFLNLIFSVDEINYNLHEWRSYLYETNYTISLDGNGNIQNLARLNNPELTEMRFDVGTLKLWNSTTDESAVPFEMREGLVKLKKSFYDVSFEDIPDVPETFILTTVYADDYQGSNQSLIRDTRNFYGIYQGSAKLTEEDLPVTGVDWNQITGDPAIAIKLNASKYVINYNTANEESDSIEFTTQIQNFSDNDVPEYIFYVNGVEKQAKSTTGTFTLADEDEPGFGEAITVKVELWNGAVLIGEDSVGIYGVKDGTDAITAFLTNESHVVVADNDGDVLPGGLVNAGGVFKVFVGGDDVTTQCTFSYVPVDPEIISIGSQSSEGITVSIGANTGIYIITALAYNEAFVDFQVTIPAAVGLRDTDTVITRTYSIAKSIKGGQGDQGIPGVNAKTVRLTATPQQVVIYDSDGDKQAVDITLTATALNFYSPEYRFLKDGIEVQAYSATNTYTILGSGTQHPPVNEADDWRVEVREDTTTDYEAFDVLNIYGLQAGQNGITVVLSNEAHTLQQSSTGTINYAGSGTTIKVWKGAELQTYRNVTSANLAKGEWRLQAITGTDVTPQDISTVTGDTTKVATVGVHDDMLEDVASVLYQIEVYGIEGYIERTQSLSLSKQGLAGEPGLPGDPGPDGRRVAQGVIWYGQGAETAPADPVNPAPPNQIVYDFDTDTFNAYPDGWQQESPEMVPGSASSKFYTARYNVTEDLDANGDPTGTGIPTFSSVRNAFVFNQVVAFQSEIPAYGYTEIDGGYIKTVRIQSINYDAPDTGETFADAGMVIDLLSSRITSKYMVLDDTGLSINGGGTFTGTLSGVDGNFSGTLTGSSGVFGNVTINSGGIFSPGFSLGTSGLSVTAATIGGWSIDTDAIYTGTKDTSGYTSGGITFYSNGTNASIHSKNFYIDLLGNASFRGEIQGSSLGSGDLTVAYTQVDSSPAQNFGDVAGGKFSFTTINSSIYGVREYLGGTEAFPQYQDYILLQSDSVLTSSNLRVAGNLIVEGSITEQTPSPSSLTQDGYQKLPGGVILQWGFYNNSGGSIKTVNFGQTFPSACTFVGVTMNYPTGGTASGWGYAGAPSTSSFTAVVQDGENFWWFALGY